MKQETTGTNQNSSDSQSIEFYNEEENLCISILFLKIQNPAEVFQG